MPGQAAEVVSRAPGAGSIFDVDSHRSRRTRAALASTTRPPLQGAVLIVCLLSLLLRTAPAVSDETPSKAALTTSLGLSAMVFNYAEYGDNGGLLDYEYGVLPGVMADISRTQRDWFVTGKLSYFSGDVLYDGQTQSGLSITTHTDQNILDLFLQMGRRFHPIDHFGYTLYAGVGEHRWTRDIRSTTTVQGLTERYRWEYVALGAMANLHETNRSRWEMNLRWQRVVDPQVDVDFRGAYDSSQLTLGERTGLHFSVPWTRRLSDRSQLVIEPFYERWELGRSANHDLTAQGAVVGTVFEPQSVTNNRGVTVSIRTSY